MSLTLTQFRSEVRRELGDDVGVPTIFTDDESLNRRIKMAVRIVNRKKPNKANTPLTLVSGQIRYDAPTGLIALDRVVRQSTTVSKDEVEIPAVYEPHHNKIHLTDTSPYFGVGSNSTYTIEYDKEWTEPAEGTATDMPAGLCDGVIAYAVSLSLQWIARRMVALNRGAIDFTEGRYSEKGVAALGAIRQEAKDAMGIFEEAIGADEPALEVSTDQPFSVKPALTGAIYDENGWTGDDDSSGMRSNNPGGANK